jgi:hypothetical protein
LWHLAHDAGIKIVLRELGERLWVDYWGAVIFMRLRLKPLMLRTGVFSPLVVLAKSGSREQQVVAMGCMWALVHGNANNKVMEAVFVALTIQSNAAAIVDDAVLT